MAVFEINGTTLDVPEAMLTPAIRRMLEKGWYEGEEYRALSAHLATRDRVLELGSGIGYLATICGLTVGAQNVTTVEANPELQPVIQGNFARNGVADITLIHGVAVAALSGEGDEDFHVPPAFWAAARNSTAPGLSKRIEVPGIAVDSLLDRIRPTVLIVDVEGAEEDFFQTPLPNEVRVIVMELHPECYGQQAVTNLFQRLFGLGFGYQVKGSSGAVVVFVRESQTAP